MPRYDDLRPSYSRPYAERAALVRREIEGLLGVVRAGLGELEAAGLPRLEALFGARCGELLEIAREAAGGLAAVAGTIPESGAEVGEDRFRDLRHDLRGPIGTLRGAVVMLARRPSDPGDPLVAGARALADRANEMRDVVDALMDESTREAGAG